MKHHCPACQRELDEPGFCPFDGTKLESVADKPTVVSAFIPVPTVPDTLHGVGDAPQVRAVSASETPAAVVDALRERGNVHEYDRLVGQTLEKRYIIERKIGEGGMGVVFAARHTVIERPLAIKVLKRAAMRDAATVSRFKREAQAASRIGHPNIVDVTDFGETDDHLTFSVMELIEGPTLSKLLKSVGPFPPERAVRIASQIARALDAAHGKGIVHRDLKPENVFLIDRDGRPDFVKIVDFGIAKIQPLDNAPTERRLTRVGSVFGTPEYMAPEQAAGRGDTDRRVDIYALGTMLYEMLVGKVPHKGNSAVRTIAMQMLDPITPPSQVRPDLSLPRGLEQVVMKALAKKREDRYQTMAEVLHALDGIAGELAAPTTISLVPLPGADPAIQPGPSAQITSVQGVPPGRARPATKPLHEPEFVAAGSRSFDHVFDEAPAVPPRKKWPLLALALAGLTGIGGVLVMFALHEDHRDEHVATPEPRDAAPPPADAMVVVEAMDADLADAGVIAIVSDAGTHRHDGGATLPGPHPLYVDVEVLTRPGEANVYVGSTLRGPSGVTLRERYGTKLHIECRTRGYKGSVDVVFDGKDTSKMCTAVRTGLCVKDLHNPFDRCDDEPGPVVHPDR